MSHFPEPLIVVAQAIEDDSLILFPEEFGIEPGDEFEIRRKGEVIEIICIEKANSK